MAIDHHHYERAFEAYLRARRIPYVSVNEARKSLLPPIGRFPDLAGSVQLAELHGAIKSFDFIVYGTSGNLLIDIKGRRRGPTAQADLAAPARPTRPARPARSLPPIFAGAGVGPQRSVFGRDQHRLAPTTALNSWVTRDDISSLSVWERLFGQGFVAEFVFLYWCDQAPADGAFDEILQHDGRWYAMKRVAVEQYAAGCKQRSGRWRTVDVPAAAFEAMGHRRHGRDQTPLASAPALCA